MRISSGPAEGQMFGVGALDSSTARHRTRWLTLLVALGMVFAACGGPAAPGAPSAGPSLAATDSVSVGPVTMEFPVIDAAADLNALLATSETDDRTRAREQAGFAREVGTGWGALSLAVDDAMEAITQALAAEFGIDAPAGGRDMRIAFIGPPPPERFEAAPPASLASALAIVTASLVAGQALGQGGTKQTSKNETRTTTTGDDVATVTVKVTGTITSTGSRVVAEFTIDMTGNVSNTVSGATAQMTGSATAHVEIDGCPDAGGSSKGKMSLSSRESVSGQHDGGDGTASWTRDLSGDFDIAVDDDANTRGVTMDVQANESVVETVREPGEDDSETDGHELGSTFHVAYSSGPGLTALAVAGEPTVDVSHERDATNAHLVSLTRSAAYAISVAAFSLGRDAETFWRDGKCIEVIVAPAGGDVDANSTTTVIAKVKHRFEGNELNKPVEATLGGVKKIDPQGQKKPAPATFIYTAGPKPGAKGDVEFKSVSNRGIGKKSVTFTVKSTGWTYNHPSPLASITGTKCDGVGGDWVSEGTLSLGVQKIKLIVSIDETTLEGTFNYHLDQTVEGFLTTADSTGNARIVLNADGSVTMTLDPAKITTRVDIGTLVSTYVSQGDEATHLWTPAPAGACP